MVSYSELTKSSMSSCATISSESPSNTGESAGKMGRAFCWSFESHALAPAAWKYSTGFPPSKVAGVVDWYSERGVKSPRDGEVCMVVGSMLCCLRCGFAFTWREGMKLGFVASSIV